MSVRWSTLFTCRCSWWLPVEPLGLRDTCSPARLRLVGNFQAGRLRTAACCWSYAKRAFSSIDRPMFTKIPEVSINKYFRLSQGSIKGSDSTLFSAYVNDASRLIFSRSIL